MQICNWCASKPHFLPIWHGNSRAMHTCDLNDRYLQLQNSVNTIMGAMEILQETLSQRRNHQSNVLTPVNITKLKTALTEAVTQNAHLAMQNNNLTHKLSFMPPTMRQMIARAKAEHSPRYSQQRTHPQHLVPAAMCDIQLSSRAYSISWWSNEPQGVGWSRHCGRR